MIANFNDVFKNPRKKYKLNEMINSDIANNGEMCSNCNNAYWSKSPYDDNIYCYKDSQICISRFDNNFKCDNYIKAKIKMTEEI